MSPTFNEWLNHKQFIDGIGQTAQPFSIWRVRGIAECRARRPVLWIADSVEGRIITFAGGVPLDFGDKLVGKLGVNGGSGWQDQNVAAAVAL